MITKTPDRASIPCTLTEIELNWAAHFLDVAGDRLGSMSCNDFTIEDTPEHRRMLFEAELWNSGGRDWCGFQAGGRGGLFTHNNIIPYFLAARLNGWEAPCGAWEEEVEQARLRNIAALEAKLAELKARR